MTSCPSLFDLGTYRTATDTAAGENVLPPTARAEMWHETVNVHQDALIWKEPRLSSEYWQWRKFGVRIWSDIVFLERPTRLRLGIFPQWQKPKVNIFADDLLASKFIFNPNWWRQ